MRGLIAFGVAITASLGLETAVVGQAAPPPSSASARLLDNSRVRVYRASRLAAPDIDHGPAVVVWLEDGATQKAGAAVWLEDAAANGARAKAGESVIVVQPRRFQGSRSAGGSKPGDAPFTGMSFTPLFENDRVSVIRARMDVGAREGFHTHASDTVVVHLSGGEIEDTTDGKTVVNRWKRGDVEFEGLGTSHSARNIGGPVDVVLVVLKPS